MNAVGGKPDNIRVLEFNHQRLKCEIFKKSDKEQKFDSLEQRGEDFVVMDEIKYARSVVDFELTGLDGEYGKFLKSYEDDINSIERVVLRLSSLRDSVLSGDYSESFKIFKSNLLRIHTKETVFRIDADIPSLFTETRFLTNRIRKYLESEDISDRIKSDSLLEFLDALSLCAANFATKVVNTFTKLRSVKEGLEGSVIEIKKDISKKIATSYAPKLIRQLKIRNVENTKDEYHAHFGNYLQQMIHEQIGLPDIDDRFFSVIAIDKNEENEFIKYVSEMLVVKQIFESIVDKLYNKFCDCFYLIDDPLDIRNKDLIRLSEYPCGVENQLENHLYSGVNQYFESNNTVDFKKDYKLNTSYLLLENENGDFICKYVKEMMSRWAAWAYCGFKPEEIIFENKHYEIYSHAGVVFWCINKRYKNDDIYGQVGENITVRHIADFDIWMLGCDTLASLTDEAFKNTSDLKVLAEYISSNIFLRKMSEIKDYAYLSIVQRHVEKNMTSKVFVRCLKIGLMKYLQCNKLTKSIYEALKDTGLVDYLVQYLVEPEEFNRIVYLNANDLLKLDIETIKLLYPTEKERIERLKDDFTLEFENKNLAKLIKMVKCGFDCNSVDKNKMSLVMHSIKLNRKDFFDYLLEMKVDLNLVDKYGMNAFLYSCMANESYYLVKVLSLQKKDVTITNSISKDTCFHLGAQSKSKYILAHLLRYFGVSKINSLNNIKYTALMVLLNNRNSDISLGLDLLIKCKGLKLDLSDCDGNTALHHAVKNYNVMAVKLILTKELNLMKKNKEGYTAIHSMILCDDSHEVESLEILETLLNDERIDINKRDSHGITLLMASIINNKKSHFEKIKNIKDINYNLVDENGMSAYLYACEKDDSFFLDSIIDHDINTAVVNNSGDCALHFALSSLSEAVFRKVIAISKKELFMTSNSIGVTPLMIAVQSTQKPANDNMAELVALSINILNESDKDGNTALHYAVAAGNLNAVHNLLKCPSLVVTSKNNKGDTALHFAVSKKIEKSIMLELINVLLADKRIIVNEQNNSGVTPLMIAIKKEKVEAVKILVTDQECLEIRDKNGKSAFDLGIKSSNDEIKNVLASLLK